MKISKITVKRVTILFLCFQLVLIIALYFMLQQHLDELYERLHPASQIIVYITKSGSMYHASSCRYLWNSKFKTTLRVAVTRGYGDCSRCNTPEYVEYYDAIDSWSEYVDSGYISEFIENHAGILILWFLSLLVFLPAFIVVSNYYSEPEPTTAQQLVPSSPAKDIAPSIPEYILHARAERINPHSFVTLLWAYTDLFISNLNLKLSLQQQTYLWTAYFYVATKIIRKQSIVDKIRSTLGEESKYYFNTRFRGVEPYLIIQNSYREFRIELNDSNIDPRTSEGRNELWNILLPRLSIPPEIEVAAKKEFIAHTLFIIYTTEKMYIRNIKN